MDFVQPKHYVPAPMNDVSALGIPAKRTRWGRAKWWIAGGLLLVVLVVAGVMWRRRQKPIQYDYATITRGELRATVTATGTLSALTQVDVGSEISGKIARVLVDYNDRVEAGQVLAELDTTQLNAQLRQAQASVAQSRAQAQLARIGQTEAGTNLERAAALSQHGLITGVEQQSSQYAQARAGAQVSANSASTALAQANLDQVRANLARASIIAPISGMVLRRSVEPGQTVAAALQAPVLFTLVESLAQMQLKVDIDEADIGNVHEGQEAEFHVDAHPNRSFRGTITSVRFAPRTVQNVVTYEAVIQVPNEDLALRPGMTATALITTNTMRDVWLVPNTALRFSPPETGFRGPQRRNRDRDRGPVFWIGPTDLREPPVPVSVHVLAADGRNSAIEDMPRSEPNAASNAEHPLRNGMQVIVDLHREATVVP